MTDQLVRQAVNGGASTDTDTLALIGKAVARMDEITSALSDAKNTDTARYEALRAELSTQGETLSTLKAKHDAEVRDAETKAAFDELAEWRKYVETSRPASKGAAIAFGSDPDRNSGYQAGDLLYNIMTLRDPRSLPSEQMAAKAALDAIAGQWTPPAGKSTIGTTDATGGWVIPNAQVDQLLKTGRYQTGIGRIVTHVQNTQTYQIDIPWRSAATSRATVATWGSLKENRDLAYNGYTATLYTIAAIYDLSKQFVKYSRGAAEADVLDELGRAFDKGTNYYILRGTGSSEPYGLQTAITNSPATFTSSFSPATTLAGSVLTAIATCGGALADRDREADAAILSGSMYWSMLSQGTDTAGFFFAGQRGGNPEGILPNTLLTPFGLPVYPETQIAGSDDLIVGAFRDLKVYHGDAFRIDTSDESNTRWDYNLVGFRGEGEIGLDARPAVYTGSFQFVADITP